MDYGLANFILRLHAFFTEAVTSYLLHLELRLKEKKKSFSAKQQNVLTLWLLLAIYRLAKSGKSRRKIHPRVASNIILFELSWNKVEKKHHSLRFSGDISASRPWQIMSKMTWEMTICHECLHIMIYSMFLSLWHIVPPVLPGKRWTVNTSSPLLIPTLASPFICFPAVWQLSYFRTNKTVCVLLSLHDPSAQETKLVVTKYLVSAQSHILAKTRQ